VQDLTPYPANARVITDKAVEQTAESIRQFGWQQPLIADRDLVLIAGHTRLEAAKRLGLSEVPVIIAEDLTDAQARAYRIADNRTHDYTTWDYSVLAGELDALDPGEFGKVLDLADWQAMIDGFTSRQDDGDLMSGEDAATLSGGFSVTVVFASQEEADGAGPALMAIPGVLDVRHPR